MKAIQAALRKLSNIAHILATFVKKCLSLNNPWAAGSAGWRHAWLIMRNKKLASIAVIVLGSATGLRAGDADIQLPSLKPVYFSGLHLDGQTVLSLGLVVCVLGVLYGLFQYFRIQALPVHRDMRQVSETIWETCKTYLRQQGKFIAILWTLIALCAIFYFSGLKHNPPVDVLVIIGSSILGVLGSYGVAWFGIRVNTKANSRTAFAALGGNALQTLNIPLRAGMSIGLFLVSIELFSMICILRFLPGELAGSCFLGFAIGESLGAAALRIGGGIFTKIADIGSDLMKIVFKMPEDDPKNPGVIADCTGDNAGDSVGPTADGFETYGVTGVALITFLALALADHPYLCASLIVWIFAMRALMIVTSLLSFFLNNAISNRWYKMRRDFDLEAPLTSLVWLTSLISIAATFFASYWLLGRQSGFDANIWWVLSAIISCGTLAGASIPELTKAFTSSTSRHVNEITECSARGGASLNILSGFVAGNFSAFWMGLAILLLMSVAYFLSQTQSIISLMPAQFYFAAPIFAFGLVAFGFLGMGPVTIAVDSFGPVADNAQSVFELSKISSRPNILKEIAQGFEFTPDLDAAKQLLEKCDGAGNTFKATAKPVLIGTAVVGATTMVFSIIILLERLFGGVVNHLSLVQPQIVLGLLTGGAVIYWFTGASTQAVVTGAYSAVVYIKDHIALKSGVASEADSKEVVRLCTMHAQKGIVNIFMAVFLFTLGFALFNPYYFIGYLVGIAFFGLYQAVFMSNAGGAWDNAKKIVEVDLKQKGTPLHAATVVGDTVGDPFKDTSSVAMNPIIKFTTLFGLLTTEMAVTINDPNLKFGMGALCVLAALAFVYRSFYAMRIPLQQIGSEIIDDSRAGAGTENLVAIFRSRAIPASERRNGSVQKPKAASASS